jgi:hypothetical protein
VDPIQVETLLGRNRDGEDHGERLWNLAVLEQWFKEMVDGRAAYIERAARRAEDLDRAPRARVAPQGSP